MRILLVRKNKYVMQSTALTNKINDCNKMQKKSCEDANEANLYSVWDIM